MSLCNGNCIGSCYGACSSCLGGCSGCSGCSDCASSCTGCSGCRGKCWSCSGCGEDCSDGCGGSCSKCSSCSGACQGSCDGCGHSCSDCASSCSSGCAGCSGNCNNGCTSESANNFIDNLGLNIITGEKILAKDIDDILSQIIIELNRIYHPANNPINKTSLFTKASKKPTLKARNNMLTDLNTLGLEYTFTTNLLTQDEMEPIIDFLKTLAKSTYGRENALIIPE
jgi:hypothetical protein